MPRKELVVHVSGRYEDRGELQEMLVERGRNALVWHVGGADGLGPSHAGANCVSVIEKDPRRLVILAEKLVRMGNPAVVVGIRRNAEWETALHRLPENAKVVDLRRLKAGERMRAMAQAVHEALSGGKHE